VVVGFSTAAEEAAEIFVLDLLVRRFDAPICGERTRRAETRP
jgi:hypothetical protein